MSRQSVCPAGGGRHLLIATPGACCISNVCDGDSRYRVTMATPSYANRPDAPSDYRPATAQLPPGVSLGHLPTTRVASSARRKLYSPAIHAVAASTGSNRRCAACGDHRRIRLRSAGRVACRRHGLMQLMPATARRFGVSDAFDPTENLHGGARYLRLLLDQFQQMTLAIAAYNAGENTVIPQRVRRAADRKTRVYVARVLDLYDRYRREC